MFPNMISK